MSCSRDDKLRDLREHTPTIFAPNCWGVFTYHHLGLEFRSPLINMFIHHDDYVRFLADAKYYMSQELTLKEMYIDQYYDKPFPVGALGDVTFYMNHYKSFEDAKECWERRKKRIDWDNLFVMLWEDEDPEIVKKFMALPYERKICFVPWETDEAGVISVQYKDRKELQRYPFWELMNNIARGKFTLYDDVELLHDGNYVQIANLI